MTQEDMVLLSSILHFSFCIFHCAFFLTDPAPPSAVGAYFPFSAGLVFASLTRLTSSIALLIIGSSMGDFQPSAS